MMIKLDLSHLGKQIDWAAYQEKVTEINEMINKKTGAGSDYLGWADYPITYDKEELKRILHDADYIRHNFDILVVCGIGGSYLGARAAIDAIKGLYPDEKPEIIYMGQTVAPSYIHQVLKYLKGKRFAINCISKSGTTTETAIGFRLLKDLLISQIGEEASKKAIYVTTDAEKGALLTLSQKYGYPRYVLPNDVGGRYSVFTAVGLLPMAVAGIDVKGFLKGALDSRHDYNNDKLSENDCYKYAVVRHELYSKDHIAAEMFVSYEPKLVQLGEWWKQLFGESEGKDGTGLLPISATFTTDLHSLGQFIQDGSKVLFETTLRFEHPAHDVAIPHDEENLDGLNYLDGKTLDDVCQKAELGTVLAHSEVGGVPNVMINVDHLDAYTLGYLMYFYMRCCAMSAYLNGINPFNQPGVEVYKKNMFHLLEKPGY